MPKARSLDDLLDDWTSKDKRLRLLDNKIIAIDEKRLAIVQSEEYRALVEHGKAVRLLSDPVGLRLFFTLAEQGLSSRQVKQKVKKEFSILTLEESYLQPYIHFGFVQLRDGEYRITGFGRAYLNYIQKR